MYFQWNSCKFRHRMIINYSRRTVVSIVSATDFSQKRVINVWNCLPQTVHFDTSPASRVLSPELIFPYFKRWYILICYNCKFAFVQLYHLSFPGAANMPSYKCSSLPCYPAHLSYTQSVKCFFFAFTSFSWANKNVRMYVCITVLVISIRVRLSCVRCVRVVCYTCNLVICDCGPAV